MFIGLRVKNALFLSGFNKTQILSIDFRKISRYQFYEKPSIRSRVIPCGRTDRLTDRHDEANSRFLKFCERA